MWNWLTGTNAKAYVVRAAEKDTFGLERHKANEEQQD